MANAKPKPDAPATMAELLEVIGSKLTETLEAKLPDMVKAEVEKLAPKVEPAALDASVKGYLDKNMGETTVEAIADLVDDHLKAKLPEMVEAAMPETPAQKAQRERESFEETVEKQRASAARRARSDAKKADKAAREAAEVQAKRDADAEKAFESAQPFIGDVSDITDKIVRGIAVDNGRAYSADHRIDVRYSQLESNGTGGLVLTKAIELPARGREFAVKGISLITDAGVLRTELNGQRKCGGGRAISFPAGSLVFRPGRPPAADTETGAAE